MQQKGGPLQVRGNCLPTALATSALLGCQPAHTFLEIFVCMSLKVLHAYGFTQYNRGRRGAHIGSQAPAHWGGRYCWLPHLPCVLGRGDNDLTVLLKTPRPTLSWSHRVSVSTTSFTDAGCHLLPHGTIQIPGTPDLGEHEGLGHLLLLWEFREQEKGHVTLGQGKKP